MSFSCSFTQRYLFFLFTQKIVSRTLMLDTCFSIIHFCSREKKKINTFLHFFFYVIGFCPHGRYYFYVSNRNVNTILHPSHSFLFNLSLLRFDWFLSYIPLLTPSLSSSNMQKLLMFLVSLLQLEFNHVYLHFQTDRKRERESVASESLLSTLISSPITP